MSAPEAPETEPATEAAETEAPETEAVPVDEVRQAILEDFQRELGDGIVASEIANGDIWIRVARDRWRDTGAAAKKLGFTYFCFLSGIDWMPNPGLSGEKIWDPDAPTEGGDTPEPGGTGVAGGDTRFQVLARLYDVERALGVTFKTDLDDANPTVDTWTSLFAGADWHERETWEMYGFDFTGHSGLRHLYLPSEFEGYPLRKDFPLLAREVKPWPGLVDVEPMPGEPEGEAEDAEATE